MSEFRDVDRERLVTGDVLTRPENLSLYHAAGLIVPDFTDVDLRDVWLAIEQLDADGIEPDERTVRNALGSKVPASYLSALAEGIPRQSPQNIQHHVERLALLRKCRAYVRDHQVSVAELADHPELILNGLLGHRVEQLNALAGELPMSSARPAAGLTFVAAHEMITAPRPAEIIEGVAWAGWVSVLVSESGTGKTFVLLDAAASVSSDLTWHRREVLQGSVAYVSFEGDALGLRLRAIRDKAGHRLEHVYVLRAHDPLSPRVSREGEERSLGELAVVSACETLAATLLAGNRPPIRLVIIDTVRAAMAGSEDNSEDVAAFVRVVRRLLARLPDAAAILAHHAGWQDGENQKKRERGSSAWRGNVDATLYLESSAYDKAKGEAELTLTTLKVRDAEKPAPLRFVRRRVELLEMDRRGDPVTSCIIEPDRRSREDRDAETAATLERQHHPFDLQTLKAIAKDPAVATSQDRLKLLLGSRKVAVADALARLLSRGWIQLPSKQRQPYILTAAGKHELDVDELAQLRSSST